MKMNAIGFRCFLYLNERGPWVSGLPAREQGLIAL